MSKQTSETINTLEVKTEPTKYTEYMAQYIIFRAATASDAATTTCKRKQTQSIFTYKKNREAAVELNGIMVDFIDMVYTYGAYRTF